MTTNRIEERYSLKEFGYYENIGDELVVYKKPKRVKVDFSVLKVTQAYDGSGREEYYAVRFKIENWGEQIADIYYRTVDFGWHSVQVNPRWHNTSAIYYMTVGDPGPLRICGDAKDKWSTPVIFNREQREKLQDLCKYLEDKLNGD